MRQELKLASGVVALIVMLMGLASYAPAEVAVYTPERLKAARDAAPYSAVHVLKAETAAEIAKFAEAIAAEGPEAAGVRHIVIVPVEAGTLAAAAELPVLVLADPADAARGALGVRAEDVPAALILEKGSDKPMERYFERGGRSTPNIRSMNARLVRAWRHPAIGRYPLQNGVALGGMDAVSYHTGNAPVAGNPAITSEYRGITYRFASAENRRRFAADPEKHLPAAGGWCTIAMARGEQIEPDAATFVIREGRLHLFYKGIYGDAREEFRADPATIARKAEDQWRQLVRAGGR